MSLSELFRFPTVVVVIDLIGACFIVGYAISAVAMLICGRGVAKARLVVAEGALFGLSFKAAGTLLKTLELHTWEQILMFATILALRAILKQLFSWESVDSKANLPCDRGNCVADPVLYAANCRINRKVTTRASRWRAIASM